MNNVIHQVTDSALFFDGSTVSDSYKKHLASMWTSLERRFEVARANHNTELLAMLELERIAIAPNQAETPAASLWQGLRNFLFTKAEIKVKQVCDRSGNQWWYAYNPVTGQSVYADTDTEMRLWLKQQAL
ncbi:hypothetical protein APA_2095 [Pseudanabaena sp. lw0831]|uniref:hypothetical protein n=1 Tax=Pseudanabaena sp. lw0831 TaxID=1357935 RepID=UPI001916471A|nr:hypothetical protein [Pseudanabaena sp. lw0831]GBO54147.1 hypothetical protein APA_2095 [Pseudanabaena sp. lw0831]